MLSLHRPAWLAILVLQKGGFAVDVGGVTFSASKIVVGLPPFYTNPIYMPPETADRPQHPPSNGYETDADDADNYSTVDLPTAYDARISVSNSLPTVVSIAKQNTATQVASASPSLAQNYGSAAASRASAGLASSLLQDATAGTSALVYAAEPTLGGSESQNVAISYLAPGTLSTGLASASAPVLQTTMAANTISQVNLEPTAAATDDESNTPVSAVGQAASQTPDAQITGAPRSSNALDVLFPALPTEVASSIASEYSISIDQPTSTHDTTTPESTISTGSRTSVSTTSRASSTLSTATETPTTLPEETNTTATEAPTGSSQQLQPGSVAGIATGATAAVVLIILAALLLLRRRQQGKPLLGRGGSRRSDRAYPEVAWLYDPAPTPPRTSAQLARVDEAGRSLLPASREPSGRSSMEVTPVYGGPSRRAPGPESPLLAPQMPVAHGNSPYGSPHHSPGGSPDRAGRNRSARSSIQFVKPMNAIYEEIPRAH